MPLKQQQPDPPVKSLGKKILYAGAVLCLFAFVFGSICMTIVAVMGQGENPPKIFEQMGGASCGLFALGTIICLVGWLVSLSAQPEKPKPIAMHRVDQIESPSADEQVAAEADEQNSTDPPERTEPKKPEANKPDPYASNHRRREF